MDIARSKNIQVAAMWLVNEWIDNGQDLEYCENQEVFSYWRQMLLQCAGITVENSETHSVSEAIHLILVDLREAGAKRNDYNSLVMARMFLLNECMEPSED